MGGPLFKKWFNSFRTPSLDWIQVEITSFCNASCIYCPRTVLKDIWLNRHFPTHLFKQLVPVFPKTQLIFLQGWGEPFMHPDIFEMISLAKKAGCRVGTTTNGTLLDKNTIRRLIEFQLDILGISLAGADQTNDQIRKGTSFEKLLETIRTINTAKKEANSRSPAIHIAYLLLKSGMNNLKQLPGRIRGLGVSEVVISTLDFVPSKILAPEAIRPSTEKEFNHICDQLDAVKKQGADFGINIHYQVVNPASHYLTCTENIHKAMFISSDGGVSPCVFTNLPVSGKNNQQPTLFDKYREIVFGNINDDPVPDIWRRKTYATFRESFYTADPPEPSRNCPKRFIG